MFLEATLARNPELVAFALDAVRRGLVAPGTFLVDLDAVEANAAAIAETARDHGIGLYFMSKQFGRQPDVLRRVAAHVPAAVAVNLDDARALRAAGVRLGHAGHLVQPGLREVDELLALEPELVTVYSEDLARAIGAAAHGLGRTQPVLLRLRSVADAAFAGQTGGFEPDELAGVAERLRAVPGLTVAGATAFPCFDVVDGRVVANGNADELRRAGDLLGGGCQLNAPGNSCAAVIPLLAELGLTHAEPGHALTGTTPLHATDPSQPERPAVVFATEISHRVGPGRYGVLGGGFYARARASRAVVGSPTGRRAAELEPLSAEAIDYYRTIATDGDVAVGDPVVFAFRFQAFVTRAPIAAVAGLPDRPTVVGIHDPFGTPRQAPVRAG